MEYIKISINKAQVLNYFEWLMKKLMIKLTYDFIKSIEWGLTKWDY